MKRHPHPLRYAGGRSKCGQLISSLAPVGYQAYRECFCGCASLLSFVKPGVPAWINDINPGLTRYHQTVMDHAEFIDQCLQLKVDLVTDRQKRDAFEEAKPRYRADRDPLAFFLLDRYAVNGIVSCKRPDTASFCAQYVRCGLNSITRERLEYARQALIDHQTTITTGHYLPLLTEPGTDVWIYVDPPYLTKDGRNTTYEHNFCRDDHVRLADDLRNCNHKWLLTIGDCRLSSQLYRGYRILRRRYRSSNYSVNSAKTQRPFACEMIIMNY